MDQNLNLLKTHTDIVNTEYKYSITKTTYTIKLGSHFVPNSALQLVGGPTFAMKDLGPGSVFTFIKTIDNYVQR